MDVPDLAEPIVAYRYVDPYNLRSGDFGAVTARGSSGGACTGVDLRSHPCS